MVQRHAGCNISHSSPAPPLPHRRSSDPACVQLFSHLSLFFARPSLLSPFPFLGHFATCAHCRNWWLSTHEKTAVVAFSSSFNPSTPSSGDSENCSGQQRLVAVRCSVWSIGLHGLFYLPLLSTLYFFFFTSLSPSLTCRHVLLASS